MRQVAGRALWLGHSGDLRASHEWLAMGIEAVVELADHEEPAVLPRDLLHGRFPLSDIGDDPDWKLDLAVETVARLLSAGVPTLVCCSAGMNRSVAVVAAALSQVEGYPLAESLRLVVGSGPADLSPSLLARLQARV